MTKPDTTPPAASGAAPAEVPYDGCLNHLGWKMYEFLTSNGAIFDGRVFNNMKGFLRDCIMEWLAAHPAALASPQVAPALTDERIRDLWIEQGLDECDPEGFARVIEREVRALATPVQVAPTAIASKPKCKTCGGSGVVDDGEIDCDEGGMPYENGPVKCVKDCPACATRAPVAPQDDARDAAKWRALPAYAERHQVNLVHLFRDIDDAMSLSTPAAKPIEPTLPTQGEQSHD